MMLALTDYHGLGEEKYTSTSVWEGVGSGEEIRRGQCLREIVSGE